ncbi:MAG: polysaccharide export protein [Sphingomonadales bacterium]|nr:polysaccharide export protein [Sphingomonadales bacterium]
MIRRAAILAGARGRGGKLCALVLIAMTAACGGRGGPIPYDPPGFVAPDPLAGKLPELPAMLSPGDVVVVRVFKVDSLSGEQAVDSAGRIKVPLIGAIMAAGRTTDEVQADIARALGARYLTRPDVQVTLKSSLVRTVAVDGSVQQPGIYPAAPLSTLVQTIALAHGTTEAANTHRVVVFRTVAGQRMAASFDLARIRRGESPDPAIYPDDIVVVDGSSLTSNWKLILQSLPIVALFRPFG